jgi:hypothetical protein
MSTIDLRLNNNFPFKSQLALHWKIKQGKYLQEIMPIVANYYNQGNYLREIVEMHGIDTILNSTPEMAVGAVYYALRGHEGGFGHTEYSGLMTREHLIEAGRRNKLRRGKETGKKTELEQKGLFSEPLEKRIQRCKKIASSGGRASKERKAGYCGLTQEERSEYSKQGVIAKGQNLWTDYEKEFVYQLSQDSRYQKMHRGVVCANLDLIFKEHQKQERFPNRTWRSVQLMISQMRQKNKSNSK